MKPNLGKLENLSDAQLEKILADIDAIGFRKAAEQASKDTDRSIDKTCIQRLKERSIARRFLVESPDATPAAAEILRFAVTGRPDFSDASIKVLEETAFKLSLVSGESQKDELKALNQITVMLTRFRNAAVRERMAKIREDKLQLRREELEWKKSLRTSSVSTSANSVSFVPSWLKSPITPSVAEPPPASNPTLDIRHSKLASLPAIDESAEIAKALDDLERRACTMFHQPCDTGSNVGPMPSPGVSIHQGSRESQVAEAVVIPNGQQTGGGVGNSREAYSDQTSVIYVPSGGNDQSASSPFPHVQNSPTPGAYLQNEKNSARLSAPEPYPPGMPPSPDSGSSVLRVHPHRAPYKSFDPSYLSR